MRLLFRQLISTIFIVGLFAGCNDNSPVSDVKITRLERILAHFPELSTIEQDSCIDLHRAEIDALFAVLGEPNPDNEQVREWTQSPVMKMFQPPVDSIFPDLYNLQIQLGNILNKASLDSLGLPQLEFATVVWGKPQPIVRVDSVVLIALNHYLGADFEGYSHWEEYRRYTKTPEMIPYDLAAALAATQHPFSLEGTPMLLNWMLYEGALVEARMQLVPEARLNMALGYRPDQLQLLEDNTVAIWHEMATQKLIYETNPSTINRLLAAAPSTPLLGGRAPGRTARYIGYKIVKEYLRHHPSTSLSFLLSPQFYGSQQSLIDSGF